MYNATKYLRLSYTSDRANESDSIANQRKYIDEFVKRNPDIKIVNEQVDDGYSGIVFDRPAFKAMLEDIKSGKINCIIVKDLSRLGREYNETFTYLRRVFPALGVRFIAINDNIDTAKESVTGDISVSFKGVMNDEYCRDISVKVRTALNIKRKNGDFVAARAGGAYRPRLLHHDAPHAAECARPAGHCRPDGGRAAVPRDGVHHERDHRLGLRADGENGAADGDFVS